MIQRSLSTFFLLLFISGLFAQNKVTIAVMELKGRGISDVESEIITARLRTDLFNTNKFTVVERESMKEILDEQGFQMSGCTSNECIIEAGKLLGVKQILAGNVGKIGKLFTITIRLIDVTSGKILKAATEDCRCEIEDVLTSSIKNVAEILAGQKVSTST